jgi:myo-inositol 2-dehydrogenase/D-chiro-inositol 1-dehydrogenase
MPTQVRVSPNRRQFLQTSATATVAGTVLGTLTSARANAFHTGGNGVLKVGLVGCGGRGTGAAVQALRADPEAQLVAMGDTFADHIEKSLNNIKKDLANQESSLESKLAVTPDTCFTGFDAYKQVIDSGVDVVLLCSPPHFRPMQLKYAIEKNKHVFAEKPVAVDIPGVRSVMQSCEEAEKKGLCVVGGLCYRYNLPMRETVERIHDGAIGDIVALNVNYLTNTLKYRNRQADWSDMEYQLRNWANYVWLSGDHNVEQHIHSLDKAAWVMKDEPPVSAIGVGGRQSRDPSIGNIFDHFAIVYEYANGTRLFASCRQMNGCDSDVSDHIIGTKGRSNLMRHSIVGEKPWRSKIKNPPNMWQREHDEMFPAIRAGKPINNGLYLCRSNVLAIMGRMAAYTGQRITWEQAMNSQEDFSLEKYEWGPLPIAPIAKPGFTKFV